VAHQLRDFNDLEEEQLLHVIHSVVGVVVRPVIAFYGSTPDLVAHVVGLLRVAQKLQSFTELRLRRRVVLLGNIKLEKNY